MKAADGTKIAERWASQYSWAKKRLLRYAKAIEELSAAEERERVLRDALEGIRFICTAEGHAPCRCGGMAYGEVCANTCICEWPDDIRPIVASALATPALEQPAQPSRRKQANDV